MINQLLPATRRGRDTSEAVFAPGLPTIKSSHKVRSAAVVLLALPTLYLSFRIVMNPNLRWDVVGQYLFDREILGGVLNTVVLTIVSMGIGIVLGALVAVARMSSSVTIRSSAVLFISFLRATPLMVQLIFWYSLGLLFPIIGFDVPFTELSIGAPTNQLISGFTASILGLSLHEAALMAEIFRGGILSVDRGQYEAARALGMYEGGILRRIIFPQAMRAIIPPTGNDLINLLKATAMVVFIAGGDLMTVAQTIYSQNFLVIPLLIVATFWYLVLASIGSIGQFFLERRFGQGFSS